MNRHEYQTPEYQIEAQRREWEREWTSNREHLYTYQAIFVLLLCAFISGILVIFMLLAWFWNTWTSAAWAVKIGVTVMSGVWFFFLRIWKGWIEPLERIMGVDWNRDGRIGNAEPEQFEIRVIRETDRGNYEGSSIVDVGNYLESRQKWQRMCKLLATGTELTYENFTPAKDGWFSRPDFKRFRDRMNAAGWIELHDGQAPVITTYGRQVFQHFAKMPIEHWAITPPLDEYAQLEDGV